MGSISPILTPVLYLCLWHWCWGCRPLSEVSLNLFGGPISPILIPVLYLCLWHWCWGCSSPGCSSSFRFTGSFTITFTYSYSCITNTHTRLLIRTQVIVNQNNNICQNFIKQIKNKLVQKKFFVTCKSQDILGSIQYNTNESTPGGADWYQLHKKYQSFVSANIILYSWRAGIMFLNVHGSVHVIRSVSFFTRFLQTWY